jgi:hypothetical protein
MLATYENARILGPSDNAPTDMYLEVTNSEGAVAEWFNDFWWTELLERWASEPVTLHIAATPGALLDPTVLHQLEMVGRVAPRWRMVGHAYRDAVSTDDHVRTLATTPYHEVRFTDEPHTMDGASDGHGGWSVGELFGRIRGEQTRVTTRHPILVRLPNRRPLSQPD